MLAGQKRKRTLSIGEAINKSKEQMNVARFTFAVCVPQAITAMTFDKNSGLCAVARSNGQLELWATLSWTMMTWLPSVSCNAIFL